jgi:hypothetical protein
MRNGRDRSCFRSRQGQLEVTHLPRVGEHIVLGPVSKRKGSKPQAYEVRFVIHCPEIGEHGEIHLSVKKVELGK